MKKYKPLEYRSITKGNTSLIVENNTVSLVSNKQPWMGLDLSNYWQAFEFGIELNKAYGIVTTSGLGLGIIQTMLLNNPKVDKVIAYEFNKDVIDIFYEIALINKINISRLEIIQNNADNLTGITTDCLYLDHFEKEPQQEIIDRVLKIEKNNTASLLWYWPAGQHYLLFCEKNRLLVDHSSYIAWKNDVGITRLPERLNNEDFNILYDLKERYVNHATFSILGKKLISMEKRNKLIKFYKDL